MKNLWFNEAGKYNGLPLNDLGVVEAAARYRPYLGGERKQYVYYPNAAEVGPGAALEAAKAMRRVDPTIKLIASGSSNFGPAADWIGWNRVVLERLRNDIDYISLHTYIGNRENNFERFLAAGADVDERIEVLEGQIRAVRAGRPNARPIFIAYDEWNVWYRARGSGEHETGRTRLEEKYNYEDALAMGMFLNSFIRHADSVKMANLAQVVNVIAPIFTNEKGLYLQTIYFPLAEYAKQKNTTAIDTLVTSPTYEAGLHKNVKYLDVSTTLDEKSKTLYLNVLNRNEKLDIPARIDNVTGTPSSTVDVWELRNSDLKTIHTFGDNAKVRPTTRSAKLDLSAGGFSYTFPKASLTILKLKVQ